MADPEKPMLELTEPAAATAAAPRQSWHLVTNQLNLMYLLSAGLIPGPKGFGRKYYADPLSAAPGWIPLFDDAIPQAALKQATSEERHLQAVIACIDLSALRGPVQALDGAGQPRPLQWPDEARGDERLLWVPAPLPVHWVQSIVFPSKETRSLIRDQAADYANVPINAYKQQIKARLFSGKSGLAWPMETLSLPDRDQPLHHASAIGAVQGLLVGLGNRGAALVEAGRLLAEPADRGSRMPDAPLLRGVLSWADRDSIGPDADVQGGILARLLAGIVGAKVRADDAAESEWCPPDVQQVVLDGLEAEREALTDAKWKEALGRLIGDLKGAVGLGDATVSELLQRHPKPFSRGLLLYFLRRNCGELLAMERPLLTDQDYVVAAALFGARGGWMELPLALTQISGLTAATAHRMATLAHRQQDTGLDLGSAPPRVKPLRELLADHDHWSKRQQNGALQLARDMGWREVLKTRISLGKGEYRLLVDGRGAHLLLDGDVKAVTTDVDASRLFDLLATSAIPATVEGKVRTTLIS